MRIIAGEFRGRKLVPPHGRETTRPITDKVKETLFNQLNSHGILPGEPGAHVADVFCGTGSLGLEALSRGAEHCIFVELSRQAGRGLKDNLASLGLAERCTVIEGDGLSSAWLDAVAARSLRVAFLDPPYALMRDERTRQQLQQITAATAPKLEPGGVIVLRGPAENDASPQAVEPLDGPLTYRFKHMAVHYFQKPPEEEAE
jgi:16S rRNA (guanine(966)-N(2))-methyltransferase RsmD